MTVYAFLPKLGDASYYVVDLKDAVAAAQWEADTYGEPVEVYGQIVIAIMMEASDGR